jgi:hypothetical protein
MSEETNEILSFERIGENGMKVVVRGTADTLRSMFRAALMEHPDMRKLLMPVIMDIIKDPEFVKQGIQDLLSFNTDEDEEELTTD